MNKLIVRMYDNNMSLHDIAEMCKCNIHTIINIVYDYKIVKRGVS